MTRAIHPIEVESYAILRARVDTSALPPLTRSVVERVVHASADTAYVHDLVTDEESLRRGQSALRGGAPLVVDAEMVRSGIPSYPSVCRIRQAVPAEGRTRSAQAFRDAYAEVGRGAVWAVGNAPTALFELLALDAAPALVVGLPVGFVGAVEAKQALRESGLPAVSNRSEKGGSAVAAAAVNALLYIEVFG